MKTVRVCLDSIDKVKGFVNDISRFNTDFDLISGRYEIDEILKALQPYVVE